MANANQITLLNPLPEGSGYLNYTIVDNVGFVQTLDVLPGAQTQVPTSPDGGPWGIAAWFYPGPDAAYGLASPLATINDPNATVTLASGVDGNNQNVYDLTPVTQ